MLIVIGGLAVAAIAVVLIIMGLGGGKKSC
jgi:hypothetical protein